MNAPAKLKSVTLKDKYVLDDGRVYLTGTQAIVRLLMVQRRRDEAADLNTAGFISGYRGSPMTALDNELWRAGTDLLKEHHIHFWPGVNENLAMTSVWGTQQVGFFNDAKYDGVFSMWYGKGPGLDQSIDALRQANLNGTTKSGGVLVLAGDDPEMRSTVDPYHSELMFEDLLMPVLYPADIQEVFDLGLFGIALSRFCGSFVGYKLLPETIETAASIDSSHNRIKIVIPEFDFPADGVNSRIGDSWLYQEERVRKYKLPAALAFARANHLNYVSHEAPKPKFGIAAMGKTWRDVQQALSELGIDEAKAAKLGITILKVAMPFPSDDELYGEFASGLDEVLVVEDKREQIENGFRRGCYNLPEGKRPKIVGRKREDGQFLISPIGELTPSDIAQAIAERIRYFHEDEQSTNYLDQVAQSKKALAEAEALNMARMPYFCSGCPHNTSTKTPEGSASFGGVGCHFMANWMDRDVHSWTHMGGEGAQWIGQAPFVETEHMFQQLGDGTYFHSGSLAVRAAVAAGVNLTYKILYNDAVAMTGGQPVDGQLTVPMITHQMTQEGVKRIVVVTDEPEKYDGDNGLASGTDVYHRREMDKVQRDLREIKGVTVLVYDQTCAAEKRRRRKKGLFPDPPKRAFINDRVCEGCGDCSEKSNCLSVQPVDTIYGRKREIHQSSCNKDYSCVEGFCPSFVTVHGGELKSGTALESSKAEVPDPKIVTIENDDSYGVLVTGVGGTGVVTIGALLGMAAHLQGMGVSIVDQMGFAQKGGPVMTHIRFANEPSDINTARLNVGATDVLIGCDMLAAGGADAMRTLRPGKTRAFVNLEQNMSGDFVHNPDLEYPIHPLQKRLGALVAENDIEYVDATKMAAKLLGDAIAANLFLVGYAWQKGSLPLSKAAILQAIELNGVKVDWNKQAFEWGRLAAHDLEAIKKLTVSPNSQPVLDDEELVEHFSDQLQAYQDVTYAEQYRSLVNQVWDAEAKKAQGMNGLARAVTKYAYKLMAYKDEYEVARLHTEAVFSAKLENQFEGNYKLKFHLSPPLIARKDPLTGNPRKMEFGSWILILFRIMAKFKWLRGTSFDIFGYSAERKMERELIEEYERTMAEIIENLNHDNHSLAVEIASLPEKIRGYGHVKLENVEKVKVEWQELVQRYRQPVDQKTAA